MLFGSCNIGFVWIGFQLKYKGVITNKKRLVLAGILSVLCANGLTVHAVFYCFNE